MNGKIALIKRSDKDDFTFTSNTQGEYLLIEKASIAKSKGAKGAIFYDYKNTWKISGLGLSISIPSPLIDNSTFVYYYDFPAISVGSEEGNILKNKLNQGPVSIKMNINYNHEYAKEVAYFSSKGPVFLLNKTDKEIIMKPDIIAPGKYICAAKSQMYLKIKRPVMMIHTQL